MTDLERVARAWNEEHARWSVQDRGDVWGVCRRDGDTVDDITTVRSLLGADKRMFALRDDACARAVLTELRKPSEAHNVAHIEVCSQTNCADRGYDAASAGRCAYCADIGDFVIEKWLDAILSAPQP